MKSDSTKRLLAVLLFGAATLVPAALLAAPLPNTDTLHGWIEDFKKSPKGPFQNIKWFCNDGSVLPPKAYACREHGGGVQHGELNTRAKEMRAGGYEIGTVLASVDANQFAGSDADLVGLKQILLERFLIGWDDGWIYRGARSYRGALQVEDEEASSKRIVTTMLADSNWQQPERYMLLRETIRLLPLERDAKSASVVRQLALQIAEKDKAFTPLRAKIHNVPDAQDAQRVRDYAKSKGKKELAGRYEELAGDIDSLYAEGGAAKAVLELAAAVKDPALKKQLEQGGATLEKSTDPNERLGTSSHLLTVLRDAAPRIQDKAVALQAFQTSLALETDAFTAGNTLLTKLSTLSRSQRLQVLGESAEALYGSGFISKRELAGIQSSLKNISASGSPALDQYRTQLRYLSRAPEWSDRWLAFNFGETVNHWAPIESESHLYTQDRLRGSPLLVYGAVIDSLVLDANRLAGIRHELFGKSIGSGLRALNPGLARGELRTRSVGKDSVDSGGIYILPETTADLPPVSGILTQGEGSSLSHVQLLARNLGIPNVVVSEELMPEVRKHIGSQVVLAVSPGGIVHLDDWGPKWEEYFNAGDGDGTENLVIRPDLQKLDLSVNRLIPLGSLRATDSGKVSGPKGANLGELKYNFGDTVPNGFVIPFGVFRHLLDQPLKPGGPSVWDWLKQEYDSIAAEKDPKKQQQMAAAFLERFQKWILNADPGTEFRASLKKSLQESFGKDGTYGVFVRSDTNVEDLPGFTGAGLNLTVANVVGYDNILKAIHDVWASPFDERSYGWRQSHMQDPEYVFPAVVIQLAFASAKSGVMVTKDIEDDEPGWVTVAISEGVGGAVEGQATESLRIDTKTGKTQFLAQATAPDRTELNPKGGVRHVPASGTDEVLKPAETAQLITLAEKVRNLDSLRGEDGEMMPADIEFGFKDGKLGLLQIRPFVESQSALSNPYLTKIDGAQGNKNHAYVPLKSIPKAGQ